MSIDILNSNGDAIRVAIPYSCRWPIKRRSVSSALSYIVFTTFSICYALTYISSSTCVRFRRELYLLHVRMRDSKLIIGKKNTECSLLGLFMGSCLGERHVFPVSLGCYARSGGASSFRGELGSRISRNVLRANPCTCITRLQQVGLLVINYRDIRLGHG